MVRTVLLGTILLTLFPLRAEPFELIKKVPVPAKHYSVDIMGHIYWSQDATLIRLDPATGEKTEYTNTFLGDIHSWDASNPFKIGVFHKDFNTLVFLDQSLSTIRSPVNLDELTASQATATCLSQQGGFWLVNASTGQIQQYDPGLNQINQSTAIPELSTRHQSNPLIRAHNRQLYCLIPHCCALVFDRFGNLQRRRPLKNVDNIQILNQNIYYFYKGDLYRLDKDLQSTGKIHLPTGKGKWDFARMGPRNRLYLLKKDQLYIYKIDKTPVT
ncbi:MAG: hypothetical protein KGY60_00890 [Bacteroidales bacterium]|nr:hypothetical protein [Bacteroidales bacterium]